MKWNRLKKSHKRIIFNGNGYDVSWVEEAQRRGLINYSSTPKAMIHYLDKKNVDVLVENGVLTPTELYSRYEIYLEKYYKTINIEALTMLDMLKKDILPAMIAYSKELLSVIRMSREAGLCSDDLYETDIYKSITDHMKKIKEDIDRIDELLNGSKASSSLEKAFFYHDQIIPLMEELREHADELEKICDREYWPMPTYLELLFGVD